MGWFRRKDSVDKPEDARRVPAADQDLIRRRISFQTEYHRKMFEIAVSDADALIHKTGDSQRDALMRMLVSFNFLYFLIHMTSKVAGNVMPVDRAAEFTADLQEMAMHAACEGFLTDDIKRDRARFAKIEAGFLHDCRVRDHQFAQFGLSAEDYLATTALLAENIGAVTGDHDQKGIINFMAGTAIDQLQTQAYVESPLAQPRNR